MKIGAVLHGAQIPGIRYHELPCLERICKLIASVELQAWTSAVVTSTVPYKACIQLPSSWERSAKPLNSNPYCKCRPTISWSRLMLKQCRSVAAGRDLTGFADIGGCWLLWAGIGQSSCMPICAAIGEIHSIKEHRWIEIDSHARELRRMRENHEPTRM